MSPLLTLGSQTSTVSTLLCISCCSSLPGPTATLSHFPCSCSVPTQNQSIQLDSSPTSKSHQMPTLTSKTAVPTPPSLPSLRLSINQGNCSCPTPLPLPRVQATLGPPSTLHVGRGAVMVHGQTRMHPAEAFHSLSAALPPNDSDWGFLRACNPGSAISLKPPDPVQTQYRL